jgi:hypothetical protein
MDKFKSLGARWKTAGDVVRAYNNLPLRVSHPDVINKAYKEIDKANAAHAAACKK